MKSEIKFWEYVILSGKDCEPRTDKDLASYQIALFFVSREKNKKLAA
jgi:hypothetical protein